MSESNQSEADTNTTKANEEISEKATTTTNEEISEKATTTTKEKNEAEDVQAAMDAGSEHFQPLQALYTKDYRISKKTSGNQYQNLAAFESALKKYGVWGMQKKVPPNTEASKPSTSKAAVSEESATTRRFLPHQMPIRREPDSVFKQRHHRNLLKNIEKIEGPLKMLRTWKAQQQRVRVVIRNEHGVRGQLEGLIICFDKHWNLLLSNVVEKFRRRKYNYGVNKTCEADNPSQNCAERLAALGISLPHQKVKSINRKNVEITRVLEQLLVRGEQIVLINVVEENKA